MNRQAIGIAIGLALGALVPAGVAAPRTDPEGGRTESGGKTEALAFRFKTARETPTPPTTDPALVTQMRSRHGEVWLWVDDSGVRVSFRDPDGRLHARVPLDAVSRLHPRLHELLTRSYADGRVLIDASLRGSRMEVPGP